MPDDPWNLERFVGAQAGVFNTAMAELRGGRKRSHWIWFVFPQLRGLGVSSTALFYGIADRDEARSYLDHAVLGPRLETAVEAVQSSPASSLHALFGSPDDLKFRSCMTLFDAVAPEAAFRRALDRWCGGEPDPRTLALLAGHAHPA